MEFAVKEKYDIVVCFYVNSWIFLFLKFVIPLLHTYILLEGKPIAGRITKRIIVSQLPQ